MKQVYLILLVLLLSGCSSVSLSASDEVVLQRLVALPIEQLGFAAYMPEIWEVW